MSKQPAKAYEDESGMRRSTKCAPAQMSWHLRHLNSALLNRQGTSTHPKWKMDLSFVTGRGMRSCTALC